MASHDASSAPYKKLKGEELIEQLEGDYESRKFRLESVLH